MKKALKIIFASLTVLILVLLLLPILFKSELVDVLKKEINNNINARVDFEDVNVSLLRNFPKVELQLLLFNMEGIEEFDSITLLTADIITASIDIKSFIKPAQGININSLSFEKANLNLLVNEQGIANYDILPKEDSSDQIYFGQIENYEISESTIAYHDKLSQSKMKLQGFNHSGSGKFADSVFDLVTQTEIDSLSFSYENIPYFLNVHSIADMIVSVDLNEYRYVIKENKIKLNQLPLQLNGGFTLGEEEYNFDLIGQSTNNSIADFLSIVPGFYVNDYKNIQSEGQATVNMSFKGRYKESDNIMPAMKLDVVLSDGYLKYPDLVFPIKSINGDLKVTAQEGNWDDLQVHMKQLNFIVNDRPVGSHFLVDNLFGNTGYNGAITGSMNLEDLSKAIIFEKLKNLKGIISGDLKLKASQHDIVNKNYAKIDFNGQFKATNASLTYDDINFSLNSASALLSPQKIELETTLLKIGESDFNGQLRIQDPLMMLTNGSVKELFIQGNSNFINGDELQKLGQSEPKNNNSPSTTTQRKIEKVHFNYDLKRLKYADNDVNSIILRSNWSNDSLKVKESKLEWNGSTMSLTGYIANINTYLFNKGTLGGKLYWKADKLNVSQLYQKSESKEELQRILVPDNLDIELDADIGQLIYDDLNFNAFTGKLLINESTLLLLNTQANMFNGRVAFQGSYDCKDTSNPTFDFKYDMSQIPFKSLFEKSSLFKKLNPFAEYLDGKFNSTLVISGPIGEDMFPVLNKIDASGFFETLQTELSGLPLISELKAKLGFEAAKKWYLEDSRNWFEIKEGKVLFQPFTQTINDMKYDFTGTYGLDHNIDFKVRSSIPREKLNATKASSLLGKGLEGLDKQAKALGLNIEVGPNIYFDINITGTFKKPKLSIVPTGSGGENIESVVQDRIKGESDKLKDSIKTRVNKESEIIKDSIKRAGNAKLDSIKSKANDKIDKAESKIKDNIISKADSTLSKIGIDSTKIIKDKVDDILGKTSKSDIDSIKSKLNDWNPFKKKKKID